MNTISHSRIGRAPPWIAGSFRFHRIEYSELLERMKFQVDVLWVEIEHREFTVKFREKRIVVLPRRSERLLGGLENQLMNILLTRWFVARPPPRWWKKFFFCFAPGKNQPQIFSIRFTVGRKASGQWQDRGERSESRLGDREDQG